MVNRGSGVFRNDYDYESESGWFLFYQAEVRSSRHTLQTATFTTEEAAEKWAEWLKLRIGTDGLSKHINSF